MADIGAGYAHAGESIGEGILTAARAFRDHHDRMDKVQQQVQGVLDAAKTIQINDPKTGKPKPFFSPEQVQTVQHLLDTHKAYQAGSLAAGMGMSANAIARIRQQQAMAAGPVSGYLPDGTPVIRDPSGVTKTYIPRTPEGRTATSIRTDQRLSQAAKARTAEKQQTTFDSTLKSLGVDNRALLFNPSYVQRGYLSPTTPPTKDGHWYDPRTWGNSKKDIPPGTFVPLSKPDEQPPEGVTPVYRVGFKPAVYPTKSDGVTPDTSAPPAIKGKMGAVLTEQDLQGYKDMAIGLADPKFKNALNAPAWAEGKDPSMPTNPKDPNSKTVGAVVEDAQNYMNSMRKMAETNPEYRKQIFGAAMSSATDTTTQQPANVDVQQPQPIQPAAPVQPEEDDTEGE